MCLSFAKKKLPKPTFECLVVQLMLEGRFISLTDFRKCYTMSSAIEVNLSNCYDDASRFLQG
jgi:hypothetical protein